MGSEAVPGSLDLIVGPPGSGRTREAVRLARAALDVGQRVFWVCLPHQRGTVLRRVTAGGYAALGLEVMSGQQLYYRLLSHGERLRPLVTGNERLIRIARALAEVLGSLPSPGEARLYSYAIAEAKRFGLGAGELTESETETDPEIARLGLVFDAYEHALGDDWDYDDVRTQAVALVATQPEVCEADVVIVDGLREIGPLELLLYRSLAALRPVHLTLAAPPPGLEASRTLERPAPRPGGVRRHLLPNPVAELRFVIGSLKRDVLELGFDPLDLALVVPRGTAPAALALAAEYGVPLMDETPLALADTPAGRKLLDLIELAQQPTPSRLLAVPALTGLANEAIRVGVAGADALAALAAELGLEGTWRDWSQRLTATGDNVAWALWLLDDVLPGALQGATPDDLRSRAARLAQEAARLGASGEDFQVWWAALLRDTRSRRVEPGGVALLEAEQASGRRFAKLYVVGATENAYRARENEDYFVPEERRLTLAESFSALGLPQRFQGRDRLVVDELLHGSDEVVVTAAAADQEGELVPSAALLVSGDATAPTVPGARDAASRLELASDDGFEPTSELVDLPPAPNAALLSAYAACGFKAWAELVLLADPHAHSDPRAHAWDGPGWSLELRAELLARGALDAAALDELAEAFPEAATWLDQHSDLLRSLRFGATVTDRSTGVPARVDAGGRDPGATAGRGVLRIYRLVPPRRAEYEWREARDELLSDRSELWAALASLEHSRQAPRVVEFYLWPLLGAPFRFGDSGRPYIRRYLDETKELLGAALEPYLRGEIPPRPGFLCERCGVFDLCRLGVRP